MLVQSVQKVALVLAVIISLEQLKCAILFAHLGVMTGGDLLRAETNGVIEEGLELDLGVAQDIRVGRASGFIFAQEITEHAVLVFLGEIYRLDGDADGIGHRDGIDQVLARGTIFAVVIVLPVLHEQADDFVTLLFQE